MGCSNISTIRDRLMTCTNAVIGGNGVSRVQASDSKETRGI